VLLDGDGHVRLTDFGLSKDEVSDPKGATTFCGTPEYLGEYTGHTVAAVYIDRHA
jgi:serine/threonine protein kinase